MIFLKIGTHLENVGWTKTDGNFKNGVSEPLQNLSDYRTDHCFETQSKQTNMNLLSSLLLLTLVSTVVRAADQCCLCGVGNQECESIPNDKHDMVLLHEIGHSPTCAELGLQLESKSLSETECASNVERFAPQCCRTGLDIVSTKEEEEEKKTPALSHVRRVARGLGWRDWWWNRRTASPTPPPPTPPPLSNWCSDNPGVTNEVLFDTEGGACQCPICESGLVPMSSLDTKYPVYVPSLGLAYNGTCQELDTIGTYYLLLTATLLPCDYSHLT